MEVADGIHRLTQGIVNFYLIEEGGKLALVDAGPPATGAFRLPGCLPSAAGWGTWGPSAIDAPADRALLFPGRLRST